MTILFKSEMYNIYIFSKKQIKKKSKKKKYFLLFGNRKIINYFLEI